MAKRRHLRPDLAGQPVYDPTRNTAKLDKASVRRQDDLRGAQGRLFKEWREGIRREMELRAEHQRAFAILRAEHAEKSLRAEADRTDALRELDRAELRSATDRYQVAVDTLSRETKSIADALGARVESTRKALADASEAKNRETDGRLSAVERFQAAGTGRGLGAKELWGLLAGGILLAIAIYKALHG